VSLGADDVQAAGSQHLVVPLLPFGAVLLPVFISGIGRHLRQLRLEVATEHDVGAATRHVGGDGDAARPSGLGDDVRLALMLLGVQHLVRDTVLVSSPDRYSEVSIEVVPTSTGCCAALTVLDVLDDGLELVLLREIDQIGLVLAHHRPVRRNHHHLESVDLLELVSLGVRRTGHAGELS
jgi:hypothetical protein